jgi:hypothetical protein
MAQHGRLSNTTLLTASPQRSGHGGRNLLECHDETSDGENFTW